MTTGGGEPLIVVVPPAPGPVVPVDPSPRARGRDDLDDLIDDLLPDVDDRAGWFDAGLLVVGAGLLGVGLVADAPGLVTVLGVAGLTLGCVLPLRTGWRRLAGGRHDRRRTAVLATGVPVDVSAPATNRLVAAYEALIGLGQPGPEAAAAHAAVLEAATLLGGRVPASDREREYVEERADAIEGLTAALRASTPAEEDGTSLVDARRELDEIAGFNSVTRLEALAEEARARRHGSA